MMTTQNQNQKKRRKQRNGELGQFDLIDLNEVCYWTDEELYGTLHDLIEVREQGVKDGADTTPVEVEICYIRRELQVKKTRKDSHEEYVRALQDENVMLEQAVVMQTPVEAN